MPPLRRPLPNIGHSDDEEKTCSSSSSSCPPPPLLQRQNATAAQRHRRPPTPPCSPIDTECGDVVHWDMCVELNLRSLVSVCVCAHIDEFCQDLIESCDSAELDSSQDL